MKKKKLKNKEKRIAIENSIILSPQRLVTPPECTVMWFYANIFLIHFLIVILSIISYTDALRIHMDHNIKRNKLKINKILN